MSQLKVGDKVWYAKCDWQNIKKPCPTCFGKKEVTLILGNGESVLLPCGGCSAGYNPPAGYIMEYDYIVKPEQVIITSMTIVDDGQRIVKYQSYNYLFDEVDIFVTKEEAQIRAEAKKKELDKEQVTRAEYIKKNVHKSFAWNAHYHMTEAKRHRRDALRHDEKAQLCKDREKK